MTVTEPAQPQVKEPEKFVGHPVRLQIFEGPLDLLLYLIRAHKYDIFDIPIREVTAQFVEYLTLMEDVQAEYAGDFLVTAATLMQIKARMLLPRQQSANEDALEQDELDPREELVQRLLDYQLFQEAALDLKSKREARLEQYSRPPGLNVYGPDPDLEQMETLLLTEVSSFDLLTALRRVLQRMAEKPVALVRREPFSLPERLKVLQGRIYHTGDALSFGALCDDCESRLEVVITFLAILELIRRGKARVRQLTLFDEIWIEVA